MTDREKLVELLCQATFGVNKQTIESYLPPSAIAEVADYALAHGVIVLPRRIDLLLNGSTLLKVRESVACPQLGDDHYGDWGILRLDQRITIACMVKTIEYLDNVLTELLKAEAALKEGHNNGC